MHSPAQAWGLQKSPQASISDLLQGSLSSFCACTAIIYKRLILSPVLHCSGMLPGFVSGFYSFDECHVDLNRLAQYAGATLILAPAVDIDLEVHSLFARALVWISCVQSQACLSSLVASLDPKILHLDV